MKQKETHQLQIKTKAGWWTLSENFDLEPLRNIVKVNKLTNYRIVKKTPQKKSFVPEIPVNTKHLWNLRRTARCLKISHRSTRRFAGEKRIPAVKTSRGWFFEPKEIKNLKSRVKRIKGKIQFVEPAKPPVEKKIKPIPKIKKVPPPPPAPTIKPRPPSLKWTVLDVAKCLKISFRSTRRFAEAQKIPAMKTAKGWFFDPKKIKKLKGKVKLIKGKFVFPHEKVIL